MSPEAGNPLFQMVPWVFIILIFYFLVVKPEKDKQKQLKDKIAKLQKNDQIVTVGGIHGTVVNVKEKTIIARVDDSVKLEFDKEAVTTVKSK